MNWPYMPTSMIEYVILGAIAALLLGVLALIIWIFAGCPLPKAEPPSGTVTEYARFVRRRQRSGEDEAESSATK